MIRKLLILILVALLLVIFTWSLRYTAEALEPIGVLMSLILITAGVWAFRHNSNGSS